ncbi:MAG TPA: MBL fold metallo-hydrolase [Dehalococcoidia bacterium]|nr:MBL fold metallo-hydrolase [Dehalococcoidia bacterium]
MDITILGAHNTESKDTGLVTLLIDDILAIDAGALTSRLSFAEQLKLKAILLTHQHYDHIRDIPAIGMNYFIRQKTLDIYGIPPVYESLAAHMLHEDIYSNFLEIPAGKPTIRFNSLEPGREDIIHGYNVLPIPVDHSKPTVGFFITSANGKTMFYTSDTGPRLSDVWRSVSPQLLIIETTAPSEFEDAAIEKKHLTPSLLEKELQNFNDIKGYLPPTVLVHMNPSEEEIIQKEIAKVAARLGASIKLGYEGMRLQI